MPNWCNNFITITGDEKQIRLLSRVINSIEDKKGGNLFMTLVGTSPDVSMEEYNNGAWYNTNIDEWGTKWDVSHNEANIEFDTECITMNMSTAWSPPIGFGSTLSKRYNVKVELQYEEPGCDFAGKTTCRPDGTMDEEDYAYLEGMYRLDNECFWHEIISSIEFKLDDDKTYDEFLADYDLSFVSNKDLNRVKDLFHQQKKERESVLILNKNK
jgi:hypothetical protein